MSAKVIKQFFGVEDGKIYPRDFAVGEIIGGDLADVAIREKWAVPVEGSPPAGGAKADDAAPVVVVAADVAPVTEQIAIPENWKSLKWADLKALAEKIVEGEVGEPAKARQVITEELARRV